MPVTSAAISKSFCAVRHYIYRDISEDDITPCVAPWHLVYRKGQPARRQQLFQPQLLMMDIVPNGEKTSDDNVRPKLTFYAMHAYSTYFKVTTSS